MPWVVDSCVVLDVALRDPRFGIASALCLEELRSDGLTVCPITAVEVAPQFGGSLANVRQLLRVPGAEPHPAWLDCDTERSAAVWARYVEMRRASNTPRRPVADILIGAYATRFKGLVTRNPDHFCPYLPDLPIRVPPPPPA